MLTEIPCGAESGWHIHPGEEVGYIVGGAVYMMIQGKTPRCGVKSREVGCPAALDIQQDGFI